MMVIKQDDTRRRETDMLTKTILRALLLRKVNSRIYGNASFVALDD